MQPTSSLRFQGAGLSRIRGTNPPPSPEMDQFLRRLPQEVRGQVQLYRTSRQALVDEILAQPNKLTQHALSQILAENYPDRDGENQRLLKQSLRLTCKPLFDALLPKTENPNLRELLEYAALRGMGGPIRALMGKARETRTAIPEETFQHMAECGLPEPLLNEGLALSNLSNNRKAALLRLAQNQRARIQELRQMNREVLGNRLLGLLDQEAESPALSNEAVMALIRAGANVNHSDIGPLIQLVMAGMVNGPEAAAIAPGNTPLTRAAFRGHRAVVERLIQADADVNYAGWFNLTPLFQASVTGHADIVTILLAAGADVNQDTIFGMTPLQAAAINGHAEIVNTLLQAGAEVSQADRTGNTPLLLAAENGHQAVVQRLLQASAEVNQANMDGHTPLLLAAINGHTEVAAHLLQAGANVNQADRDGNTPLLLAIENGHAGVAQLLRAHGAGNNHGPGFRPALFSLLYPLSFLHYD